MSVRLKLFRKYPANCRRRRFINVLATAGIQVADALLNVLAAPLGAYSDLLGWWSLRTLERDIARVRAQRGQTSNWANKTQEERQAYIKELHSPVYSNETKEKEKPKDVPSPSGQDQRPAPPECR